MNAPTDNPRAIDAEVERLVSAAQDALTDEMVSRLASTASDAIDLMDQVNRAGLGRAIPALAELVNNGDVERLTQLARLYSSAQDALTDEMISRLSESVGSGLVLLDRFSRGGAEHLIEMLEGLQASGALERIATTLPQIAERLATVQEVLQSIDAASAARRSAPPAAGGFGGMWQMMRDPENQETLAFMLEVGKQLRKGRAAAT